MTDFQQFRTLFAGKRILVTGNTGFKGSWLSLLLLELGADVKGYSLNQHASQGLFALLDLEKEVETIYGDIRDIGNIVQAVENFRPECIFHLAAQPLVLKGQLEPVDTLSINVMGSVSLLEALRISSYEPQVLVFVTSDKVYRNESKSKGQTFTEGSALGSRSIYGISKVFSEEILQVYSDTFLTREKPKLAIASARAGNVIGGGDWAENRIIPDIVRSLISGNSITIRMPHAVRPWQHVLDSVSGYLSLACGLLTNPSKFQGSWNFGPNTKDAISVQELVTRFISKIERETEILLSIRSEMEDDFLQIDSSKALTELNWKPRWDIDASLQNTAEWYHSLMNCESIVEITQSQLRNFMRGA